MRSRSGNQYVMVAYHCDSNSILVCLFQSRKDRYRLAAYTTIMGRLKQCGLDVDLQILDNEASTEYKRLITKEWNLKVRIALSAALCRCMVGGTTWNLAPHVSVICC